MQLEKIIVLETTADHITGEEAGDALERLNSMPEVLDAVYIPALGKKNRPCGIMQVLCRPEHEEAAVRALFRHTHALGIRRQDMDRYILPRHEGIASVHGRDLRAKIHELENRSYARPEADELSRLSRETGLGMPALRFELNNGNDNDS